MPTLRFDGPTLEDAVEAAKRQLGAQPRIVAATRVRKGGVGGFFAHEHIEVEVEVDGSGKAARAKASAAVQSGTGRDGARDGSRAVTGSSGAGSQPIEKRRPEPRRAEPRRAETRWTDEHSARIDNDDPMSALIGEMAENPPSSVLDLAEKINAEQGHFALAKDDTSRGGPSRGSSVRETSGRSSLRGDASPREPSGRNSSVRDTPRRDSDERQKADNRYPSDALAEREPVGPVRAAAPATVASSAGRSDDRREEKKGRRWRLAQPEERAAARSVEQTWDEPAGLDKPGELENAPTAGFAAVLERIAKEAGLANPAFDGRDGAVRDPEPAPASHADLILTELAGPLGLVATSGPAELRSTTERATAAEPQRSKATLDLAEPRVPSAPRQWTEPLWLPAAGERGDGGEPRWLAAPAVLARLSQSVEPATPLPASAPVPQSASPEAAVPERLLSQPAPRPAEQLSRQPAWLSPTAPTRNLPERATQAASLVPTTPDKALSELGLALQSLGVPIQACTAVTPAATRETVEGELRRALDLALPPLPPAPKSPSSVIAVVGPPNTVMSTARDIARDLGASPDEVALATQRKVWRKQDRVILSAEVATEERRSWRWRDHPSVVAIEQDVRPERSTWTTEILQALEPTICWGVAKASHKPEDLAAWSDALGGLDVLALVELDSTTTPAAALAAPIPVGRLDGEPATPALWATLLCARLMG